MGENLWAPWRMEYILSKKTKECIFCLSKDETQDKTKLILFRSSLSFVIMNRYPYNNGHLMVAPFKHLPAIEDLDGDIVFWNWNFGDKNSSSLQNPNHKYDDNGLYIVTLNVTDDDKATTSISKEIEVLNVKPSANFWYNPSSPNINDTLQYTDNSIDPDGTIVSWSWDFGNGVKSNEQSPTHKYTSQGTYKVSLTVTDNDGDLNTKIINVRIFDLSTPSKEYSGFIIIFIVFLIMLVLMMFFVFWIKKKEK